MSFLRSLRSFTGQSRLVTVHDPGTLTELGRVDAGGQGASVVGAGGAVWVAVPDNDTLDAIDPATTTVARQVASPSRPARLLAGPAGRLVVVGQDARVHLVDAGSGQVVATSETFGRLDDVVTDGSDGGPHGGPGDGSEPGATGSVIWARVSDQGVDRLVQLDPTTLARRAQVDLPDLSVMAGLRTDGRFVALLTMGEPGAMSELVWDAHTGAPASPDSIRPARKGLARSGDHLWLARDRELQLVSDRTREVLARTTVPGPVVAAATLAFGRLWVCHARQRGTWHAEQH